MDILSVAEKDYILRTEQLCHVYQDGTKALSQVDFSLPRNKVTAIIGGNGVGKTTLFLHLNGILKPSSGRVIYNGEAIGYDRKQLMTLRSQVGIVFQDPDNQLFSASVYKDISFGLKNLKLPEEEIKARVEEVIHATGIQEIRDKPTHLLSFGQKKRVAIAGVLAMHPKILVLDEPTAGLDPQGVSELMNLLSQVQETLGITILISTHDIDIIPVYCDYVYVMDKGRFLMEGCPDEIFSRKIELRAANLRLPRVAHLMEILSCKDGLAFTGNTNTISQARKSIKNWADRTEAGGEEN